MNYKTFSYIVFIMLICYSCLSTQEIGFTSPIPTKGKTQHSLESSLWGKYRMQDSNIVMLSVQDTFKLDTRQGVKYEFNNFIEITPDSINTLCEGAIYINKHSAGFEEMFLFDKMDSLIISRYHPYLFEKKMTESSDMISIWVEYKSNLFSSEDSIIIKKFKNKLYLNTYRDKNKNWSCFQLSHQKNQLKISSLTEDDRIILNRLMNYYDNSNIDIAIPSMKVFKVFLNLNGFEKGINFISK